MGPAERLRRVSAACRRLTRSSSSSTKSPPRTRKQRRTPSKGQALVESQTVLNLGRPLPLPAGIPSRVAVQPSSQARGVAGRGRSQSRSVVPEPRSMSPERYALLVNQFKNILSREGPSKYGKLLNAYKESSPCYQTALTEAFDKIKAARGW